jgi:hypothetical protein
MGSWTGATTLTEIFQTTNNWKRYVAWKEGRVRPAVVAHVNRMLTCRTVQRGMHLYRCDSCDLVKVVPHSCKSVCCSSCGKARTDQWCKELLSDLLDVPYRHLVFTIPWELRLLIQDNRQVLLDVLFRAAARAVLSLTAGQVWPRGRKSQAWLAAKKKHSPYVPGMIIVLHTFGSDLKWNPHLHVILTAGGLSRNGARWVSAPRRYLVPAPLLATEWKLNVITGVREADFGATAGGASMWTSFWDTFARNAGTFWWGPLFDRPTRWFGMHVAIPNVPPSRKGASCGSKTDTSHSDSRTIIGAALTATRRCRS